jgi:hypothetical protein
MADQIQIRWCLAQNGNPIVFSAVGGGSIKLDFDDSQIPNAAALLAWRDTALIATIEPDPGGDVIQRRGRPRKEGAE